MQSYSWHLAQSPHWGRPYIARDSEEEAAFLKDLATALVTSSRLDPEAAGMRILTLVNQACIGLQK